LTLKLTASSRLPGFLSGWSSQDYREKKKTLDQAVSEELKNELAGWYAGIVQSAHSFQMPEFQIGWENSPVSTI